MKVLSVSSRSVDNQRNIITTFHRSLGHRQTSEMVQHLQSDVEGRVSPSNQPDAAGDLLCGQPLHLQRMQPPRPVGCQDVKRFPNRQLREGGPQQVQEVCLLQAARTLHLPDPTSLGHCDGGTSVVRPSFFLFQTVSNSPFFVSISISGLSRMQILRYRWSCVSLRRGLDLLRSD